MEEQRKEKVDYDKQQEQQRQEKIRKDKQLQEELMISSGILLSTTCLM